MSVPIPQVVKQVANRNTGTTSTTTTTAVATTSGNLLVAMVGCFGNHIGATPITDSAGNTWVAAIANTGSTKNWGALFYCENCVGSATHTFTFTSTANDFLFLTVWEISGCLTSGSLNGTNSSTASTTTHASGTITAGSTYEIFVGGGHPGETAENNPATTGDYWLGTDDISTVSATGEGGVRAWRLAPPGTTDQVTYTCAAARNQTVMIAGFRSAAPDALTISINSPAVIWPGGYTAY